MVLLSTTVLVATGWKVFRETLLSRDRQMSALLLLLFAVTRGTVVGECEVHPDSAACNAVQLSAEITRYVVIGYTIVSIRSCLEELRKEMGSSDSVTAIRYLKMYQRFFDWFIVFAVTPVVLIVVEYSLLSWRYSYVGEILRETSVVYLLTVIGIRFRKV